MIRDSGGWRRSSKRMTCQPNWLCTGGRRSPFFRPVLKIASAKPRSSCPWVKYGSSPPAAPEPVSLLSVPAISANCLASSSGWPTSAFSLSYVACAFVRAAAQLGSSDGAGLAEPGAVSPGV